MCRLQMLKRCGEMTDVVLQLATDVAMAKTPLEDGVACLELDDHQLPASKTLLDLSEL